jgi:hypothetical protein
MRSEIKTGPQRLRSHQPVGALCAQNVMVEVGYPLTAGNSHVQIFYALGQVRRNAVPKEAWILVDKIGRRRIPELSIHADLFKFGIERVRFPRIHRIA